MVEIKYTITGSIKLDGDTVAHILELDEVPKSLTKEQFNKIAFNERYFGYEEEIGDTTANSEVTIEVCQ